MNNQKSEKIKVTNGSSGSSLTTKKSVDTDVQESRRPRRSSKPSAKVTGEILVSSTVHLSETQRESYWHKANIEKRSASLTAADVPAPKPKPIKPIKTIIPAVSACADPVRNASASVAAVTQIRSPIPEAPLLSASSSALSPSDAERVSYLSGQDIGHLEYVPPKNKGGRKPLPQAKSVKSAVTRPRGRPRKDGLYFRDGELVNTVPYKATRPERYKKQRVAASAAAAAVKKAKGNYPLVPKSKPPPFQESGPINGNRLHLAIDIPDVADIDEYTDRVHADMFQRAVKRGLISEPLPPASAPSLMGTPDAESALSRKQQDLGVSSMSIPQATQDSSGLASQTQVLLPPELMDSMGYKYCADNDGGTFVPLDQPEAFPEEDSWLSESSWWCGLGGINGQPKSGVGKDGFGGSRSKGKKGYISKSSL